MTQITSGLRSILSNPFIYEAFQKLMGTDSLRRKIVAQYITPHHVNSMLDIGCGPAEIMRFLPNLDYYGFDISPAYISNAKKRFGTRGKFFAQHITHDDIENLPKFDLVFMFGVLHHLNDHVAKDIINLSRLALHEGGRLLTVDPVYINNQNPIARFLVSKDRGQNVRNEQGYAALSHNIFTKTNTHIRNKSWIPYTHCFMECTK